MEDSKKRAALLIDRYLKGSTTPEEANELDAAYLKASRKKEHTSISETDLANLNQIGKESLTQLITDIRAAKGKSLKLWPGIRVAASIAAAVTAVALCIYFFSPSRHPEDTRDLLNYTNDVAPGKNGATITLANGQVILLDSAKSGVVFGGDAGLLYNDRSAVISGTNPSSRANARDLLNSTGKRSLVTRDDGQGGNHAVQNLTASTAKGQTYQFTLPDGTKVWLNADSKLEFPAQFSGKERKILMQGEAYFVVKHNDKQPFRVLSKTPDGKAQLVEDIGTEFNINAYADESSVKTTLVEGAASVSSLLSTLSLRAGEAARQSALEGEIASKAAHSRNDGRGANEITGKNGVSVTLTPNQQATLTNGALKVKTVDAEQAVAWKSGTFAYDNTPLKEVMRQIARWYNVEVRYEKESLKKVPIGGAVSRYDKVSRILKTLENTGAVKFELNEKTIWVRQ